MIALPTDSLDLGRMRAFLSRSLSSVNRNKVNGLLAELDFRRFVEGLGLGDRVSPGGWIARNTRQDYGHHHVAIFPEAIQPDTPYPVGQRGTPGGGLHSVAAILRQAGIRPYFCSPEIDSGEVCWFAKELGVPYETPFEAFPDCISGFAPRTRRFNHLKWKADASLIPDEGVAEEFSKEHVRVAFADQFFSEMSDIDGVFYADANTYPLEIKEKTVARDNNRGDYFGLDVGPFAKLAFYASRMSHLRSLFVVREIDDVATRNLVEWWFITFEKLAQFAGWTPRGGGMNMRGGGSSTILIPRAEFTRLTASSLREL